MSAFTALNIEPDEDTDDEVDDTKEIQIEEALKLYQNALKFHSQGPEYYDQAADAYTSLFESEIFKYPESLSEARRLKIYGHLADNDAVISSSIQGPETPVLITNADGTPSTLPQILYLAYKNEGQFLLDCLKLNLSYMQLEATEKGEELVIPRKEIETSTETILDRFSEALDKDDTDVELWRRVSRVGGLLGSRRIARFCLEAVLEGDDGDFDGTLEPLGLEEGFAGEELRDLLKDISDELSLGQPPMSTLKKKKLSMILKRHMDPYPFLSLLSSQIARDSSAQTPLGRQPRRHTIKPIARTWAAVGKAIIHQLGGEYCGAIDPGSGASLSISLPGGETSEMTPGAGSSINKQPRSGNQTPTPESQTLLAHGNGSASKSTPKVVDPAETRSKPSADRIPSSAVKDGDISIANKATSEVTSPVLPMRKRSSDTAGINESMDGGRVRSKRLRARESLAEGGPSEELQAINLAKQYEEKLQRFTQADHWMFETISGLLARVGVESLGNVQDLRSLVDEGHDGLQTSNTKPGDSVSDFYQILRTLDDEKVKAFLQGTSVEDSLSSSGNPGMTAFLEHAKTSSREIISKPCLSGEDGLLDFVLTVNNDWLSLKEIGFLWLQSLIGVKETAHLEGIGSSTYLQHLWPHSLKETVVQALIGLDEYIYKTQEIALNELNERVFGAQANGDKYQLSLSDIADIEMVQTIFELHLDIFSSITNPSSEVDQDSRALQEQRLRRWAALASDFISLREVDPDESFAEDFLSLRYLWASTCYAGLSKSVSREHILLCLEDLKRLLRMAGDPLIELQNNAVMPEISIAAADREISRLTTMDFFLGLFSTGESDPIAVIESLEPVLDSSSIGGCSGESSPEGGEAPENAEGREALAEGVASSAHTSPDPLLQEMSKFLASGSASLRVFLWRKLREAYAAISYPPKVFSCYLRTLEAIMDELSKPTYLESPIPHRQFTLLKWLRTLETVLEKSLEMALREPTSFECIHYSHLQSSMAAIAKLSRLLHVFNFYTDSIAVGQTPSPAVPSFKTFRDKLRKMQVHAWLIQYHLLKEGISQNSVEFRTPEEDRLDYLRSIHFAVGSRSFCEVGNEIFLKLMKNELLQLNKSENWESDLAQVLYDYYGLKLFPNIAELQEHGCHPHPLDKKTAIQIVDFVMSQVRRVNVKDLLKTELKVAIDSMQSIISAPRPIPAMMLNRRIINTKLKEPINPIDLYRALQGIGDLPVVPVTAESCAVARKGWYFMLGYLNLSKVRSQKRIAQGQADELDFIKAFFRFDLEAGMQNWETWYRLAQTFDCKLEEDVLWSADKINNNKRELHELQRSSVHCYTQALALAICSADTSFETVSKLSEFYTDFGFRIYASSRPPFSMEAFWLDDFTKFYSGPQGMYKKQPFREFDTYSAWRFSSELFKRALVERPNYWMNHYMLGKSLWKMYQKNDDETIRTRRTVDVYEVINAFLAAIDTLPIRRDSRQDRIFEPHYKIVSIVNKLVQRKDITPEEGSGILQATPYASKFPASTEMDSWVPYILQILKTLRSADKSNWHHRMVARAAYIIHDEAPEEITSAMGAKHEFMQQIFTKTMALQVWKPEHERPGRHFVYTSRYMTFFVGVLGQLSDRASLEALVKRLRKKPSEYMNHTRVWQAACTVYLKVLRRVGEIPTGHEDTVFKSINHEDFQASSARLEAWCKLPTTSSPALDTLREVVELKRLNNGLMKSTLIDDLIADTYARLYEEEVPQIKEKTANLGRKDMMSLNNLLMSTDGSAAEQTPPQADQGSKPRTKGVGRKELQRKAEAASSKPLAPPATIRSARMAEATISKSPETFAAHSEVLAEQGEDEEKVDESRPGSVHDSADDESELSELEDENDENDDSGDTIEEKVEEEEEVEEDTRHQKEKERTVTHMFPNLVTSGHAIDNSVAKDPPQNEASQRSGNGKHDEAMHD
ncbi:MAG: hypothetical protein M1819_004783 [Sarea resinae]|nr:MAG: hypothetical protein M1819_004783 [Sarea resinae]